MFSLIFRVRFFLRTVPALAFSAALLAGPVTGVAFAAAKAGVTDIRVAERGAGTRFVFDLSGRISFKIFTLVNPDRVVVDLPEVGWRLPARPLPRAIGFLRKLRYGLFKPGVSRVVMDVTGPVRVIASRLLPPRDGKQYRLVVDIARAAKKTAIAALTPPPPRRAAKKTPPPPVKSEKRGGNKRVIVIDPGHGGIDPGTLGRSGVREKQITLALALAIGKRLQRSGRYRVVLTRKRDVFVRLRDRVARARAVGAELFISIHADAIKSRSVRGLSVYTLSETASDKEAAALAEKENKADLIAGIDLTGETPEVTNILIDLAQRESMNQSVRFAAGLVKELRGVTRILRNTHRFAGFAVLKAPDIPSVLLEAGFLSNRYDERILKSGKYRVKLAAALARAVDRYFLRVEEAYRN
ncbi:MAG TPA: N-acetylmuramoyl-L-alanine amidase [Alphaproteobacteria bacterium]|nr:N-acetylmuramoyl-L-alanine amidase [Alphaproteobacteria bacterium]